MPFERYPARPRFPGRSDARCPSEQPAQDPPLLPPPPPPPRAAAARASSVPWQRPEESSGCCTLAPFLSPPTRLPAGAGGGGCKPHYKKAIKKATELRRRGNSTELRHQPCPDPRPDPRPPSAMALPPLSWLLRLAALCHLTTLLAGQHLGVKKCNVTCTKMTPEIPVALLVHYQRNQESCGKRAVILRTRQNKIFCADPRERWVQKAMEHLERQAAAPARNGGTFEKQIGAGEPRTTSAARGMDKSAVAEPKATRESSGQEAQGALGTSPELPTEVADSWGAEFPSTSKAPDGGPPAGSPRTELFRTAALTATASWQSSVYKPGAGLWAEGKASEALPPQASSTQAPATQAPPTQAPSTQTPSTQAPPTQAPSTQTLLTQAPSTQTLPTQAPSTQTLPTQAPLTQVPTILHTASEDLPVWIKGQTLTPENSLGPKEMGPISAHTDAFRGSDSMPRLSMVPVSSASIPSREPVGSGSWTPKAEEPIHATVDPQRLGVLITPVPDSQAATRRQAVGLLAFLGLLFCLGVAMFAYQSLQGCPRKMAGDMVEGLRYVPRSCGSNSYVLVPV